MMGAAGPHASAPTVTATVAGMRLLARRAHSVAEVRTRLQRRGYATAEIAEALAALAPYLDDAAFARSRLRFRSQTSKWGEGRIRQELQQQGVAAEVIAAAFAAWAEDQDNTIDWLAQAQGLVARRYGVTRGPLPRAEYAKRIHFLIRRGFSYEVAQRALRASGQAEPELD